MSGKGGSAAGKRQRKYTDADEDSLSALRQALERTEQECQRLEEEKAELTEKYQKETMKKRDQEKDLKITKIDLDNMLVENARLSKYVQNLIDIQKTFTG